MPDSPSSMAPSTPSRTSRSGLARSKIPGDSMSAGHKLDLSHSLTTKLACGRDKRRRPGHGSARISSDWRTGSGAAWTQWLDALWLVCLTGCHARCK
jgi:hypothetical protein